MKRRQAVGALAGAVLIFPPRADAQAPARTMRLAVLTLSEPADVARGQKHWAAFFEELRRLGYREGGNLVVEWRTLAGERDRAPTLVREVAALKPDIVFTQDMVMATHFKPMGVAFPAVVIAPDPVGSGLVTGLARPGGMITGFDIAAGTQIIGKRVALLKEVLPAASKVAWVALQALGLGQPFLDVFRNAARELGIEVIEVLVEPPYDEAAYRRAFDMLLRQAPDALYATPSSENLARRHLIAALALQARLPSMFVYRDHVEAGGLMAYHVDLPDLFRRSAGYIDRILRGANPAELPIQQPTRFELVINARTARALGLAIPPALLARADEVIE